MISRNNFMGLAICAAALAAGPAQAWTVTVGTPTDSCSSAFAQGGRTLFTLDTNVYQYTYNSNWYNGPVYTYQFDLVNNGDVSALSGLSVNTSSVGPDGVDYFIGLGPNMNLGGLSNGTAFHVSSIGYSQSGAATVNSNQVSEVSATSTPWQAASSNGTVTFTAINSGSTTNPGVVDTGNASTSDLTSQFQRSFQFDNGTHTVGESLFIQSLNQLDVPDVTVTDQAGHSFSVPTCDSLNPRGLPAVPEPGSAVPFALGGLGLLGLAARRRVRLQDTSGAPQR